MVEFTKSEELWFEENEGLIEEASGKITNELIDKLGHVKKWKFLETGNRLFVPLLYLYNGTRPFTMRVYPTTQNIATRYLINCKLVVKEDFYPIELSPLLDQGNTWLVLNVYTSVNEQNLDDLPDLVEQGALFRLKNLEYDRGRKSILSKIIKDCCKRIENLGKVKKEASRHLWGS